MTSRSRTTRSINRRAAALAIAAPQVVAHRMTRMAMAGPMPSARDQREFSRMVGEKNTVFAEAWQAMMRQTVHAHQTLAFALLRSVWSPSAWGPVALHNTAAEIQNAALGILDKGIAPVQRKAVANAKRLTRTRLR